MGKRQRDSLLVHQALGTLAKALLVLIFQVRKLPCEQFIQMMSTKQPLHMAIVGKVRLARGTLKQGHMLEAFVFSSTSG